MVDILMTFSFLVCVFEAKAQSLEGLRMQESGVPKAKITYDTFTDVLDIRAPEISSQMSFSTNDTEQVRIDSTGNVGIGVVAPAARLDVNGGVKFGSHSSCTASEEGVVRYSTSLKGLEFCDGEEWKGAGSLGGSQGLRECPSEGDDIMVPVGPWCVDKYEASVWSGEGGSGTQYFHNSTNDPTTNTNQRYPFGHYPSGCNRDGSGCTQYAASKSGVTPARGLSWYQAVRFCANAGKVLIPDSVWQMAAIGTYDPETATGTGGSDGGLATDHVNARCNINTNHTPYSDWTGWIMPNWGARPTGRAGETPGSNLSCISDFGVEDMVGNVWEWTDLNGVPAGEDQSGFSQGKSNGAGGPFGNDGTWNVNNSAFGCDGQGESLGSCGWRNNAPSAALRGGYWANGASAGVTALWLSNSGSLSYWFIGFRCARPR